MKRIDLEVGMDEAGISIDDEIDEIVTLPKGNFDIAYTTPEGNKGTARIEE